MNKEETRAESECMGLLEKIKGKRRKKIQPACYFTFNNVNYFIIRNENKEHYQVELRDLFLYHIYTGIIDFNFYDNGRFIGPASFFPESRAIFCLCDYSFESLPIDVMAALCDIFCTAVYNKMKNENFFSKNEIKKELKEIVETFYAQRNTR